MRKRGVPPFRLPGETVRLVVASDLDRAGNYGQTVVVTDRRLFVVQPHRDRHSQRDLKAQPPSLPRYSAGEIVLEVALAKIAAVEVCDLVGAGALAIQLQEVPVASPRCGASRARKPTRIRRCPLHPLIGGPVP